ncbi:HdaA/DnaA family protein [Sphingomonas montana]|uniref:HdaA/DnaA family protein n=1 Tax=Sphingomonas montana TaxID=1843236 RepID=UPI00096EFE8E|nr:DnaA/Hda family protein [Sphingomonas montana]
MNQIALPLLWPADAAAGDFILSPTNADAVRHLERLALWPVMATVLVGPRKSGRSLLGRIFAAQSGGTLIDAADRQPEEDLFHAWNRAQSERQPLLMIADHAPPVWSATLPDLRSRLAATPVVRLEHPDDALATALLDKELGARGLAVPSAVAAYVLARIDRSHVAIARIVDALDTAALVRQRGLTVPLARDALVACGFIDASSDVG